MARKCILGLSIPAVLLLAPMAPAAAEELDIASIAAPAACAADAGATCSEAAVEEGAADDFLTGIGIPEPISLQGDCWTELRWRYDGCCVGKTRYRQQKRTCCCCYVPAPPTRCGGWTDTSTIKCEGLCMM